MYEHIDFRHLMFLSEELFTDVIAGEKYRVGLLVETKLEDEQGNPRFIILTDNPEMALPESHLEDLTELQGSVYLYFVRNGEVIHERLILI